MDPSKNLYLLFFAAAGDEQRQRVETMSFGMLTIWEFIWQTCHIFTNVINHGSPNERGVRLSADPTDSTDRTDRTESFFELSTKCKYVNIAARHAILHDSPILRFCDSPIPFPGVYYRTWSQPVLWPSFDALRWVFSLSTDTYECTFLLKTFKTENWKLKLNWNYANFPFDNWQLFCGMVQKVTRSRQSVKRTIAYLKM